MSWIKRSLGIDGVDLTIQVGVTLAIMTVGGQIWSHGAAATMLAAVGGTSLVVLGVRRHLALKRRPPDAIGEITGEVIQDRIADLDARLQEMDGLTYRVHELEERLDFAERLLAQAREPERLT